MNITDHPWNVIHRTGGYPAEELVPAFYEAVRLFQAHGCRRVLDLGCGSGRYTLGLEREGLRVAGLDIAREGLALTRQKLQAGSFACRLVQADFCLPLPFRSEAFDAVFSAQVIHHARLDQVRRAIAEIQRVLAPGGIIFVSVSGRNEWEAGSFREVEPGTITPLEGSEAGVPHHIFSLEEAKMEFGAFNLLDVSIRAEGRVILVQALK